MTWRIAAVRQTVRHGRRLDEPMPGIHSDPGPDRALTTATDGRAFRQGFSTVSSSAVRRHFPKDSNQTTPPYSRSNRFGWRTTRTETPAQGQTLAGHIPNANRNFTSIAHVISVEIADATSMGNNTGMPFSYPAQDSWGVPQRKQRPVSRKNEECTQMPVAPDTATPRQSALSWRC